MTLVPLRVYLKRNLIKLEIGLGRSRKAKDKRDLLKRGLILENKRPKDDSNMGTTGFDNHRFLDLRADCDVVNLTKKLYLPQRVAVPSFALA